MRRFCLNIFFAFFCFLVFSFEAKALENEKLSLELYTKKSIEGLDVLFKFTLKNGWHISWQNPGDAGVPTQFSFKNANVLFEQSSAPEKFIYQDIITQYGFSSKAYYYFKLSDLKDNPQVKVSWTACKDECEPDEAVFDLPSETAPLFEQNFQKAQKTFPKIFEKPVSAQIKNNKLALNVKDFPFDIEYFIPSESGILSADAHYFLTVKTGNEKNLIKDKFIIETLKNKIPTAGLFITPNGVYQITLSQPEPNIFFLLLLAFLGGIVLNLMPCVFPVLSLKAISVAHNTKTSNKHFLSALSYTSGVVCSFLLIAGLLFALKAGGAALGWGFQLQSPVFVFVMIVLFVLILLFLFDFIPFNIPFLNTFSKLSSLNSFLTGFFAVLIASPCTGPFMVAAVGYALFESPKIYFPIFLALGLGYAFPFATLEMFPNVIRRFMPKPGKWMQTVKYILSVPIFLTVFWLSWVLYHQLNNRPGADLWQPYSQKILDEALDNGDAVFIDFTAKWCLTCLLNERTVLSSESFINAAKENEIRLLKADWTNRDEEIFKALKSYGRSSVPLYVFYPEDDENHIILPQILTLKSVLSALKIEE